MSEPFTSVTLISLLPLFSLQALTDCVFWCGLPIFFHFQQYFLNLISLNRFPLLSFFFLLQNPHWPLLFFFVIFFSEELESAVPWTMKSQQFQLTFHTKDSNTYSCDTMLPDFLHSTKWIYWNTVLWLDYEQLFHITLK